MAARTSDVTERVETANVTIDTFELEFAVRDQPKRRWRPTGERCSIGSHPSNDLVVDAPQVSRFHCEIRTTPRGLLLRDLGSSNGTFIDSVKVVEAWLRPGSRLVLGSVTFEVIAAAEAAQLPSSAHDSFGALKGQSQAMRLVFAQLERAARAEITVLIEGETGTGKEEAAAALHLGSSRADKPFVVIDCSALPDTLLESELFGHERGAFTDAVSTRIGAFEAAEGGTVFLDEVGELPSELQPKLLRVLEAREFRRLGSNTTRPCDVRLISATNRDLRKEINEGRFRADLYFRLAVLRVVMPPLRARPDDLPLLCRTLLANLGASAAQVEHICTPAFLTSLRGGAWPGNVRELRNHLERCLLFVSGLPLEPARSPAAAPLVDVTRPLVDERRRHVDAFEREYVRALLEAHGGNVPKAAQVAGVDRAYLYRFMKRLGFKPKPE